MDELIEHFTLRPEEIALLSGYGPASQLGIAVLLKFFQYEARFPAKRSEVPAEIVDFLARQLGVNPTILADYGSAGRNAHFTTEWKIGAGKLADRLEDV